MRGGDGGGGGGGSEREMGKGETMATTTNSSLSREVNKHRNVCLHSALARGGTKLYRTTSKDDNTNTLNMRYIFRI